MAEKALSGTLGQSRFFFDLADFLTWKATGSERRSHCTLSYKWTYLGHEALGWQRDFLTHVGLDDLLERGRLPTTASSVGRDLGPLTEKAAGELGLTIKCRVSSGMIDAHAGVLGTLGCHLASGSDVIERHAALIAGTSSSVMVLSSEPRMIKGVWGPSFAAVLPNSWLVDAGQSATGALLDHLIRHHGAGGEPTAEMHNWIAVRIEALRAAEGKDFAARLHVLPDFHGNRSPLAEPRATSVMSGLRLDASFDDLCRLYWRTAIGIVFGVRHILDHLNASGYAIDALHISGGHTKNAVLMELYRDALGYMLIERKEDHGVLLGAAIAAGVHTDLTRAASAMVPQDRGRPSKPEHAGLYDRDYRIFLTMQEQRSELDTLC